MVSVVDDLDALQLVVKRLGVHPFVVFVGPLDVCRGEGMAVVEFEAGRRRKAALVKSAATSACSARL